MKLGSIEEKTGFIQRSGESQIFNVSVRGWLAIILIGSVCFSYLLQMMAATTIAIKTEDLAVFNNECLKLQIAMGERLALLALGYYFGKAAEYLSRKKPPKGLP